MLFQTPEFVALFAIVLLGICSLRRARAQHVFLLATSYVFYGWWDVRFLLLLLFSSLVDYSIALGVAPAKAEEAKAGEGHNIPITRRKRLLLGCVGMLGAWLCLGLDWPLLQQGSEAFSWQSFLAPDWNGAFASLAVAASFSAVAPWAYELYYRLPDDRRRKWMLATSIGLNLGLLGFFKYCNFFLDSAMGIGHALGYSWQPDLLEVALPVGISFYTFQTLSYTIDCYRGAIQPERSVLRVALYVAYFPQLVAGPIMRPQEFLPSLHNPWSLDAARMWSGFHLAMTGLVKKVVIADSVAVLADSVFDDPIGLPSAAILLGSGLFAIQIYCDFSGYTDIARGISRIFGVEIPLNFRAPYFATSIIDFWRRWHISLSTWLRDYLYIPLGGSRGGRASTHVNLMATMILGGLWHGAAWNFVIWGCYQGALLSLNRELRRWIQARPALDAWMQTRVGTMARWMATMYCVLLGWVIFRVTDGAKLAAAVRSFVVFDGSISLSGIGLGNGLAMISLIAAIVFVVGHTLTQLKPAWPEQLGHKPTPAITLGYVLLGMLLFFAWPAQQAPFVYFQF